MRPQQSVQARHDVSSRGWPCLRCGMAERSEFFVGCAAPSILVPLRSIHRRQPGALRHHTDLKPASSGRLEKLSNRRAMSEGFMFSVSFKL